MKATLCEIKKNPQGINSEGKETGIQINDLKHKKAINFQPEQNEETRAQKNNNNKENIEDSGTSPNVPAS